MKKATVLFLFAFLLTACASTGGHRLQMVERFDFGELSDCEYYQYEDSELFAITHVIYNPEHIDTIIKLFLTDTVGDIIERATVSIEFGKEGVTRTKEVSRSDGTYSSFILEGEYGEVEIPIEYSPELRDSTIDVPGVFLDSVIYSSDNKLATLFKLYRETDAPDRIISKTIEQYDDEGRIISDEEFDIYNVVTNDVYTGEYIEVSHYKREYVYNKLGLCKKWVKYNVLNGRKTREELGKFKYDRKTGDPLKETHYLLWTRIRVPYYKAIWTYE